MRLGIFGGTFDPPHVGHLLAAFDAFEALALDRLVLIPAAVQPLKAHRAAGAAQSRLAMTELLVRDLPGFAVDPIEIERAGLSYTVDTLSAYAERYPDAERYLLVGADALATFGNWREPERIRLLARLVVLERDARQVADAVREFGAGARSDLDAGAAPTGDEVTGQTPIRLQTRRVDVSSTEIRARVRAGRSIRGFVPDAVAAYIERAGLYR